MTKLSRGLKKYGCRCKMRKIKCWEMSWKKLLNSNCRKELRLRRRKASQPRKNQKNELISLMDLTNTAELDATRQLSPTGV